MLKDKGGDVIRSLNNTVSFMQVCMARTFVHVHCAMREAYKKKKKKKKILQSFPKDITDLCSITSKRK